MPWKDPEKGRAWRRAHRYKMRKIVSDYLAKNPCAVCGFSDIKALEFDHINRDSKKSKNKNISVLMNGTPSLKSLLSEIKKCQVLCANCHRIKTINNLEWRNSGNSKTKQGR